MLLIGSSAAARDQGAAAGNFFDHSPQIPTVSRMFRPLLESPAGVSVIDRPMIEAAGVRELEDLFRLVPGFVVGYHSGDAPAVGRLGLGEECSRQLPVLVDGESSDEDIEASIPGYTGFLAILYRRADGHGLPGNLNYIDAAGRLDSSAEIPSARRLDLRHARRVAIGFNLEFTGPIRLENFENYEPGNLHEQVCYVRLSGGF